MVEQFYVVGKIINTHGIKGEIKVDAYTDFPEERFSVGNQLLVGAKQDTLIRELTIETVRQQKQFYILKFKEFSSINDVLPFVNLNLWISRAQQHELDENVFYYHQIIGCMVETTEEESLGIVSNILETGANDVWVIEREGKPNLLIPYIAEVVKKVDVEARLITIDLIPGLIE